MLKKIELYLTRMTSVGFDCPAIVSKRKKTLKLTILVVNLSLAEYFLEVFSCNLNTW